MIKKKASRKKSVKKKSSTKVTKKTNKKKAVRMSVQGWNEFNTFSKLVYPYLQDELNYPERRTNYFDEQTWVRKRGEKKGPYDGAFKNQTGVILLVEAKKEKHALVRKDVEQLFDYCLGDSFPVPPPYALLSNGVEYKWYKRLKDKNEDFSYAPCDAIPWKKALQQKGSGLLTEQLTLSQTIKLLKKVREKVFEDLTDQYFPKEYNFANARLGTHKKDFEKILHTRKSFVDPTLEKAKDDVVIKSVLSSIALSLTLKILFIKIVTDRKNDPFPELFKKEIIKQAKKFPGILKAEPYDALELSDDCEEFISQVMASASITQALIFEGRDNPIGDIWDGLVVSEELDLQVKSLGNVYTPPEIVKAMVDRAENTLGMWKDKKVMEPSCGSGHFVREVYGRMRDAYLGKSGSSNKVIEAHKSAMAHLQATDIDPFAVQTTQLGMFLELYRTPGIWNAIAQDGKFDFGKVVNPGDFLDSGLFSQVEGFTPDLIIGNPPYGVKVTKEIANYFNVGSNDSYGCFVSKGLNLLSDGGHLLLIVSNTFLTNRWHINLRKQIIEKSKIDSIYLLHRNAFAGRDVFCCVLDIEKSDDKVQQETHRYDFYDAWPIHPTTDEYKISLEAWSRKDMSTNICPHKLGLYSVPQSILKLRQMPPHPNRIDDALNGKMAVNNDFAPLGEFIYPIFAGLPSLFTFCSDNEFGSDVVKESFEFPSVGKINGYKIKRGSNRYVPVVKLWQLAQARQGLATADDPHFIRKSEGIVPNARRRYMVDVDQRLVVSKSVLNNLSEEEKRSGIEVIDPQRTRHFVPFDSGGEANVSEGELRSFWCEVDYWIDWSKTAVDLLKRRNKFKPGTPKKPRLNNFNDYFKKGIVGTITGLYAPTYRMGFGGVFGQKANLLLPFQSNITDYMLVILSSKLLRYFAKSFISASVDFSTENIRHLPIAVPTKKEIEEGNKICSEAINFRQNPKKSKHSEESITKLIDDFVYQIYRIPKEDQKEIEAWFKRRYPHFGKELAEF